MPQIVLPKKGQRAIILTGLVVAACAAALVALFLISVLVAKQAYDAAIKQAASLDQSKDYAGEIKVLNNYLKTSPSDGYRYQALLRLGSANMHRQDYSGAYVAYEAAKAAAGKPTVEAELGIAQAAAQKGDRATAAEAYRELVTLSPKRSRQQSDYQDMADFYGSER